MRRRVTAVLVVLLLVAGLGCPGLAAAQTQMNAFPGNILTLFPTAVTVANTTTATALFSTTIQPLLFQNMRQRLVGASSLHVKLLGTVTTNVASGGVGNINVGCNYGGSAASISLVNASALTANLTTQPVVLDLWLGRQGTGLVSPVLQGRLTVQNAATTELVYSAAVVGTTSMTAAQTLTCVWQWASAATTNSLTINHGRLLVGN